MCKLPDLILWKFSAVFDNMEFSSCYSTTCNILSNQEEFEIIRNYGLVDNGSRFRVWSTKEESIIYSFVYGNLCELRIVIVSETFESFFNFRYFYFHD